MGKAKLLVKDEGIIAGINFAEQVFSYVDPSLKMDKLMQDGDSMSYGDIAFLCFGILADLF